MSILTPGAGIGDLALFKDLALFLSRFSYRTKLSRPFFQRGLGATFETLSAHELACCPVIVELPHLKGGLGIAPLPASAMAAFYSATAQMVSWLGSLPHASEWVADQNLADPNTWNSSALQILKQLHDRLLTHYNCTEWAPPLVADSSIDMYNNDVGKRFMK